VRVVRQQRERWPVPYELPDFVQMIARVVGVDDMSQRPTMVSLGASLISRQAEAARARRCGEQHR
jgi:hypothetical protein